MSMRVLSGLGLAASLTVLIGCGPPVAKFDGPTVKEFTGRLVHDGKPVSFPADEKVSLKAFHEKAESFGIPIGQDGSFKIGWMPVGKYSCQLVRAKAAGASDKGGQPRQYALPGDALVIVDGKTEYNIELGKGYKDKE